MRKLSIALCLLTVSAIASAQPQEKPRVAPKPAAGEPSESLLQDASAYAARYFVDVDEAVRRLLLQHEIGDLNALLSDKERGRFAGLFVQHEPEFKAIVRFTDPFGDKALKSLVGAGPLRDVLEIRPAQRSLLELEGRQAAAKYLMSELGVATNSSINVFENRVDVFVVEPESLTTGLEKSGLTLPEGVEVVAVDGLALPTMATIHGGVHLSTCSGGFTVKNSSNELGILTSGHCGNTQSFAGTSLPFRNDRDSGNQDLQWHSACGLFDVTNQFETGIGLRSAIGTRHRNSQAVNSYLCSWGKTTGRKCGTISTTSFDPGVGTQGNYNATFVRVANTDPNYPDLSAPGDCGGPWFVEDIAYGVNNGSVGPGDAYYSAINYVSSIGVSVLTSDPGPGCNQPPNAFFTSDVVFDLRVDFDASGSSDPDGTIVSYFWDFDDGTTQTTTSPTVTHWYDTQATYFVMLRVTDDDGDTDVYFDSVHLCEGFEIECEFF